MTSENPFTPRSKRCEIVCFCCYFYFNLKVKPHQLDAVSIKNRLKSTLVRWLWSWWNQQRPLERTSPGVLIAAGLWWNPAVRLCSGATPTLQKMFLLIMDLEAPEHTFTFSTAAGLKMQELMLYWNICCSLLQDSGTFRPSVIQVMAALRGLNQSCWTFSNFALDDVSPSVQMWNQQLAKFWRTEAAL